MRNAVSRHGGRSVKALGDGLLLAFGSPGRALACAIDVQRELARRKVESPDAALAVRIGLNAGEVLEEDGDIHGQAVNAAARIAAKAKGNEILVSEIVKQLVGSVPHVSFRDRGKMSLKGFPDRWRLFDVAWDETMSLPDARPLPLRVRVLGGFAVSRGERPIADFEWKRRKAKSLFKILLLSPGYCLLREQAIESLWPGSDPSSATKNLATVLYSLRRTLAPDPGAPEGTYVFLEGERIGLRREQLADVDLETFRAAGAAALANGGREDLERAADLYAGELLPDDLYEDWSSALRESARAHYLSLLWRLGERCREARDYPGAADSLRRLVAVDPCHEEAQRTLMHVLALAGRRHEALRQYQTCVEALRTGLDADPLPETAAEYEAILAGRVRPEPAASARLPGPPAGAGPFVGREEEFEVLQKVLDRAVEAQGQVVAVSGDMGVGKTRLSLEFLARAGQQGATPLLGSAREGEGVLPYGPVVEALDPYWRATPPGVVTELFGDLLSELVLLWPALGGVAEPPTALDPDLQRQRLFHAVAEALRRIAGSQPLVLFLDDLHAADGSTLELVSYLVRRCEDAPVMVLAALRSEAARSDLPVTQLIGRWAKAQAFTHVELAPLSPPQTTQLVSALMDEEPAPGVFAAVSSASEGNPFFAREMIRSLGEAGPGTRPVSAGTLNLPATLRQALRARASVVRPATRSALALASVVGHEFGFDLLRAAGEADDASLLDAMDEALAAGLVEETETGYRFHHGLLRQVFYEDSSAHRRTRWHKRVAEAIETVHGQELEEHASVLARHYEAGGVPGLALRHALVAAERAQRLYAVDEALDLYGLAVRSAERVADASAEQRIAIDRGLGEVLFFAGRYAEAAKHFGAALDLVPQEQRRLGAAMGTLLGLTLERVGEFDGACARLREAIDRLAGEPACVERARCLNALGLAHVNHGEHELGLEYTREALEEIDRSPPGREALAARASALRQLGMGLGEQGDHEAAVGCFMECLRACEELRDEPFQAMVLNCLGSLQVRRGRFAEAAGFLERGLTIAIRLGDLHVEALCRVNLGDGLQAEGRAAEALPHLERSLRIADEAGERSLVFYVASLLVPTALGLGDIDSAERCARRAVAAAEALGSDRERGVAAGLLGEVAAERGQWDEAATAFRDALSVLSAAEHRFDLAQVRRRFGRMLLKRDRIEQALAEFTQALELFEALGAEGEAQATRTLIGASRR